MFETLPAAQPDAILKLMMAYRADPRTDKVDLGVGIYKDAQGATPVMQAVKSAEGKLLKEQDTNLRVIADLVNSARPDAKIWLSDPTWPNHGPLLAASGAELEKYPYYDAANSTVTFDAIVVITQPVPT